MSAEGEHAATERAESLEEELFEVNSRSAIECSNYSSVHHIPLFQSQVSAELEEAHMQLEAEQTERRKFQAIAEPPKSKCMQSGHYTADVDLTALNVIADVLAYLRV